MRARRRRLRRRGALAAVTAGVAVAGVVVVPQMLERSTSEILPGEVPGPKPTPEAPGGIAPPIDSDVIQLPFDPATVPSLPLYPIEDLPQALDPFASSNLSFRSMHRPLAFAQTEAGTLALFYIDTGWSTVEPPEGAGEIYASELSRDGRRVAVSTADALWVRETQTSDADWQRIEVPRTVRGDVAIEWTRDSDRLILTSHLTGYLVDLESGEQTELPYLGDFSAFDVAPDGRIVARQLEPRSLAEWDGTEQVSAPVSTGGLGGLTNLAAFEDAVAATRIDLVQQNPRGASEGDGIVVLDRGTYETRAFLPFTGESGQWVDGDQVRPLQWLNKVTVLLSVYYDDVQVQNKVDMTYLVAWNTMTGDLGLVGQHSASVDLSLADLYPS